MVDQAHQAGAVSTPTTASVATFFRSMPKAMRMIYVGGAVMVVATRMPYGVVSYDGDSAEATFTSTAAAVVPLLVAVIAWLCVPAVAGRLTTGRRIGIGTTIAALGLMIAGGFAQLPQLAKSAEFLPELDDLLGTKPPTASPGVGLILLAAGLVVVAVGFLRLRNAPTRPSPAFPAQVPTGFAPPTVGGLPAPTDIRSEDHLS